MRCGLVSLAVALVAGGPEGCGWGRKKKEESASKKLLGFEDTGDRLRDTSLEDMEKQQARPRNGLQLTINTSKEVYKHDEPLVLDVKIRNVSGARPGEKARDIPVYFEVFAQAPDGRKAPWLLRPTLYSESNSRVVYRVQPFGVAPEKRGHRFVLLPPGAFVGHTFRFPGSWLRPGRSFSFTCVYEAPEDFPYVIRNPAFSTEQIEILGRDRAYVRVWTGRIYSGRATFRIQRKSRFLGLF